MLGPQRKHALGEPAPEKKPRARPVHHEDADQARVVKWLRDNGQLVIRSEQGGDRSVQKTLRDKSLGMQPAACDLVWVLPLGQVVWIEVKATRANGGKPPRPDQEAHHAVLRNMLHTVIWDFGSDAIIEKCKEILARGPSPAF